MIQLSKHNFAPQEASARCALCGRPIDEHEFSPPSSLDGAVYSSAAATQNAIEAAAEELL